jgi:hypothetical protein
MPRASGNVQEPLRWDEFASRHAGQSFLTHLSLCSLNESLIEAIQKVVPGFFSEEEERFERDLARTEVSASFARGSRVF